MSTIELKVAELAPNITECEQCLEQLVDALRTAGGVREARVSRPQQITVVYDPEMISVSEIERNARALGVRVSIDLDQVTYTAEDLCCLDCAERVGAVLSRLEGVHAVSTNFAAQVVDVVFHPDIIGEKELSQELDRAVGECHRTGEHELRLKIEGMDCAGCAANIEKAARRLDGVTRVQVNFTAGTGEVFYQPEDVTPDEIINAIEAMGYEVHRSGVTQSSFTVSGIHCADCATGIEGALKGQEGVVSVELNPATGRMTVSHEPQLLSRAQIISVVESLGYQASLEEKTEAAVGWFTRLRRRPRTVSTLICGIFLVLGLALGWAEAGEVPVTVALSLAIAVGGYPIAKSAVSSLRTSLSADMNVLMSVAVIGAVAIGEWHEAATVVVLFSVANALEAFTSDRTRNAIRSLMDLSPDTATVLRDGQEITIAAESVEVDDTVIVKPGERLPVDGVVQEGLSEIDQAPVTGESEPVSVEQGSEVFAGTVNGPGLLQIRSTKTADDTTIARIIHLVEEAQAHRSPAQRFVDRFARHYTPAVIGLAALITAVPPLVLGQPFQPWFYRALTLLVLACPCALVISTPVAIAAAIANGARNGVLVKGGAYIERLASIRQFVLDKTGTLTLGRPQVTDVIPADGWDEDQLLRTAATVEAGSEHALARAILRKAEERGLEWARPRDFRAITGQGAQAMVDGALVHVGSPAWIAERGADMSPLDEAVGRLQEQAKTAAVVVRSDGSTMETLGVIGIADQPRGEAARAIRDLRALGVERVTMLTGDSRSVAEAVAEELAIDDYAAELLPNDKVDRVRDLKETGPVAMVGDGVNDAPALAVSDVGVAMGAAGTDVAIETADVALMSDDLSRLPYALRLSKLALRIVKQNIVAAILIKLAFMVLVVPGWLTLWMAILGDTGVSIAVTLNSMRLLGLKPKK